MADEQQVIRSVSWNEVFSFSHILKSFKMAIHPSKIILALLAIILTCALGVVMDKIWSGVSDSSVVMPGETWGFWTAPSRAAFLEQKEKWLEKDRVESLGRMLNLDADMTAEEASGLAKDDFDEGLERVRKAIDRLNEKSLTTAEDDLKKEKARIDALEVKKERKRQLKIAEKAYISARRAALQTHIARTNNLEQLAGSGIFAGFMDWEGRCLSNAVGAVRRGNFATGVSDLLNQRGSMTPAAIRARTIPNRTPFNASTNNPEGFGVLAFVALMLWGLWWMVSTYKFYSLIYIVIALAIWSVLGGAICRIAALHAAREEKISIRAALSFSLSKYVGFFTAPLLPLGVIVLLGLLLALGGLIGAIPAVGEWVVAILFFLALILGVVIAFLTIGLIGGAPLMWPTIAVEGSDSFDAISRSFSYTFQRPFRYGLYWLVAAIYGTICYLFVRLFALIALLAVHFWAGWSMTVAGKEKYAAGAGKLDVMWTKPTFDSFYGPWQSEAMTGSEAAASVILAGWVYLVIGVVAAFGICFFFSAATNIYYLLRRKIDATDLDDVYVEEAIEQEALPEETPPADTDEEPAGEDETGEEKSE
ncbi:MAG: hypothetical protein SVV80_09880 [Planctomycetota bacterium]|nr:hypothetical protein [Planctomycetota bacterium]